VPGITFSTKTQALDTILEKKYYNTAYYVNFFLINNSLLVNCTAIL